MLVAVKDRVKEEQQHEAIMEPSHDLGIPKRLDSKEVKCHFQRRVPKFGFKNINRKEYQGVNIDVLQSLVEAKKIKKEVSLETLIDLRLVGENDLVKILGRGKLEAALKVEAHKFTATAQAAIEAAGGEAVTI